MSINIGIIYLLVDRKMVKDKENSIAVSVLCDNDEQPPQKIT